MSLRNRGFGFHGSRAALAAGEHDAVVDVETELRGGVGMQLDVGAGRETLLGRDPLRLIPGQVLREVPAGRQHERILLIDDDRR